MNQEFLDYAGLKSFKDHLDKDINTKTDTMKNDLFKDYVSRAEFEELKLQVEELKSKLSGN